MRSYVVVTGVLFSLLTAAHIWRVFEEPHLARDPWFIAFTLISAVLSFGAWRLVRRSKST